MADIQKMLEEIKGMTVMELNDLVKAIEEEFGVSAAASIAVAAPAAEAAPAEEEKTEFKMVLKEVGAGGVPLIKAIKDVTDPALTNRATVNNFGTIELKLSNYADVNGNGGNIEKLQNVTVKDKNGVEVSGIFYVKSSDIHVKTLGDSNGKIVFDGVINQFVGTEGNDTKIYQTVEDVKDSNIDEVMTKTGITVLWLSHNVTIEQGTDGKAKTWSGANRSKLTGIVVKAGKTVTLTSDKTGTALNIPNAVLTVESTAKLKINNAMNVTVKSYNGNIDLGSNSKLNEKVVHSGN